MVHKREREKKEWYSGHDGEFGAWNSIYKKSVSLPQKNGTKYTSMFYPCIRNLFVPSEKKQDFKMEKSSKKFEVSFCVQNYFHARTSLCDVMV